MRSGSIKRLQAYGEYVGCAAPQGLRGIKRAAGYRHGAPMELWRRIAYLWLIALNIGIGGGNLLAEENSTQTDSEAVRVYKQFIESPPIIKSLKARVETRGVSYIFLPEDITDLESFTSRLKQAAAPNELSFFLRTNLARSTRNMLSNYHGGLHLEL